MSIKHKIKFKGDRVSGTYPAVLRFTGPKQRPERVATTPGVRGERTGRSVSSDDMDRREYLKFLKKFFKGE